MSGSIAEQLASLVGRVREEGLELYGVHLGTGLKDQQAEILETAAHLTPREVRGTISASLPADCALVHLVGVDGGRRTEPLYWGRNLTAAQQEIYRRLRLDHTDRDRAERIARAL